MKHFYCSLAPVFSKCEGAIKRLWASLGLCLLVSCSVPDRDLQDKLDSSMNLLSQPKNVLPVYTLAVPWTCEQATEKIKDGDLYRSMLDALLLMQVAQCNNLADNESNPDSACVTVITHSDNVDNDTMRIVGYVPLFFSSRTISSASKKLIELAKLPAGQDPSTVVVESAIGTYPIAQYLNEIKNTTPVIVLMPRHMSLTSKELTPELYRAAFKITK
jgi:hypothetical protein